MKVLVTGSRHWTNKVMLEQALFAAQPTIVVHGNAKGADILAGRWALENRVVERFYPAKWDLYGRAAGKNRNLEMLQKENLLDEPIDLVLAFPLPDSIGTYHMMQIAADAGIPIVIFGESNAAETV